MTRDEWVVLPIAGQVEHRRFRRDDIGDYWPRQFQDGEAVMLMRRHTDLMFTVALPLAEFEALLFGPAEGDAIYKAAAVAWAEAETRSYIVQSRQTEDVAERARDAFFRLYDERHDAQR